MQGTKPHIIIHHTVCVTSILTLLSSRRKKRGFTMAICCLFVCSFICSCVRLSPETHAAAADVFCCCRPWPAASLLRATPPMSYMFPPRWNLWLWRGLTRGVHKGATLVFLRYFLRCYDITMFVIISILREQLQLLSSSLQNWLERLWDHAIKCTRWQHPAMTRGASFAILDNTSLVLCVVISCTMYVW